MASKRTHSATILQPILQRSAWAAWTGLLACTAFAACSKAPASGDVYVSAFVGGGTMCSTLSDTDQILLIGTQNIDAPSTVPDGTGTVTVDCTVSPSGGGYALQLGATGPGGGKLSIIGNIDATNGGTVRATFYNQKDGGFEASSCTLSYTYDGTAIPPGQRVSAGNVFAHIDCPSAVEQGGAQGPNGPSVCDANADFLFTNCAQ